MDNLNYHAIHEPTGKRAIYKEAFERLAGKYMKVIANSESTHEQIETALHALENLNRNTFVDNSFSGAPVRFITRSRGQS